MREGEKIRIFLYMFNKNNDYEECTTEAVCKGESDTAIIKGK